MGTGSQRNSQALSGLVGLEPEEASVAGPPESMPPRALLGAATALVATVRLSSLPARENVWLVALLPVRLLLADTAACGGSSWALLLAQFASMMLWKQRLGLEWLLEWLLFSVLTLQPGTAGCSATQEELGTGLP